MANDVNARLLVQILANNADFIKGMQSSQKQLTSFTSNVTKLAGTLGLAFGIREVVSFGFEVSKLAGQAEGVRNAFDRLPESKQLMDQLKDSTKNTVSELELMKRAVQAQNFNIALGELPKLLEFASLRAQQTGQSVDYLVDSIVTGIGRKSPLILDNLGISAIQLSEEFKRTGDFTAAVGNIIDKSLSKMPGFIETAATQGERLNASMDNLEVALGNIINQTGVLSEGNDSLAGTFQTLTDFINDNIDAISSYLRLVTVVPRTVLQVLNGIGDLFSTTKEEAEKAIVLANKFREQAIRDGDQDAVRRYTQAIADLTSQWNLLRDKPLEYKEEEKRVEEVGTLKYLREQLNLLKTDQESQTGAALAGTNQRIKAVQEEIKVLENLGSVSKNIGLIGGLEEKIKSLNEELKQATSLDQIIDLELNIDKAQDQLQAFQDYADLFKISVPVEITTDLDLTPDDLRDAFNGITAFDKLDFSDAFAEARETLTNELALADESVTAVTDSIQDKWARTADSFLAFSSILSSGAEDIASGQTSAIQALQKATLQIIDLFYKQALAAAISKAITSGGPLPVGLAFAGVALGIVKGLFRRETGVGGGGGGVSAAPSSATRNTREASTGVRVEFGSAEFKFNGRELKATLNAHEQVTSEIGG